MELPTTHLTLDEIDSLLYSENPPLRHQVIQLALEAKNNHLYRKIINIILDELGEQEFGMISRESVHQIVQDHITWFVHRPLAASKWAWTGTLKDDPCMDPTPAAKPFPRQESRFSADLVAVD